MPMLAAALVVLVLSFTTATGTRAAEAAPFFRLSFESQIGYDNDLLADPDALGTLEPVASPLASLGPLLDLQRRGLFAGRDRGEARLGAGIAGYSAAGLGTDRNLRGSLLYQLSLSARTLVEASGGYLYFRRSELPVFDVDGPEAHLRVARAPSERWLVAGEAAYSHPSYPGRALDAGGHQRDDRLEIGGSLLRSYGKLRSIAARFTYRYADSNDPYVVHRGPLLEVRALSPIAAGWHLRGSVAYSERSYPNYPVLLVLPMRTIDTGRSRHDEILQLEVTAERALWGRIQSYAEVTGVHQWSNIGALSFGEARFVLGFQIELWRVGREDGGQRAASGQSREALPQAVVEPDPLAPEVQAAGITFKVRAPEAQHVALVGGWNGWDERRQAFQGPDAAGIWRITVPLPPGTWRYAFVIDGKWVRPDGAPRYEEDGFGMENGILDLDAPGSPAPSP